MERRSVVEYLGSFLQRGRECAYVQHRGYRTVRWTYRQVAEAAFRFARELEASGIGKGERVLLWGPNSAEWVAAFFGCALRGVIAVPIDDAGAGDFTQRVFQHVDARLLVCSREHVLPGIPVLILEDLPETLLRHAATPYDATAITPDDGLEIVFTSGTTAEPKGVVITHGNVLGNIAPLETEIQKYLKYERWVHPVRFLNLLPLSHVFGQFLGIFLPQLLGSTVIFQNALKPGEVIRTIRRERISVLAAVPHMLQSLKEKIERDLEDAGRLEDFQRRFQASQGRHFLHRWWIFRRVHRQLGWKFWAFISGGAALDRVTEEFWGRLGYAAIQGYGLTETTSIVSVNHPFRLGKGSIGKVLAGREVKLAPDGEILVRGSGVAAGYWTGHELQPMTSDQGLCVVALSNQDVAGAAETVATKLAGLLLADANPEAERTTKEAREILLGLRDGRIDRSLLTPNANAYFTDEALGDFRSGLAPLGELQSFVAGRAQTRGGMATRVYDARYAGHVLQIVVRAMPDGRLEQYTVSAE